MKTLLTIKAVLIVITILCTFPQGLASPEGRPQGMFVNSNSRSLRIFEPSCEIDPKNESLKCQSTETQIDLQLDGTCTIKVSTVIVPIEHRRISPTTWIKRNEGFFCSHVAEDRIFTTTKDGIWTYTIRSQVLREPAPGTLEIKCKNPQEENVYVSKSAGPLEPTDFGCRKLLYKFL